MFKIRKIKYANSSTSVQVYKIENRKRVIIKHIGSAKSEQELNDLLSIASDFIVHQSRQFELFGNSNNSLDTIQLSKTDFIGVLYSFTYELLYGQLHRIGFVKLRDNLFLDLVVMRLFEPSSKLRSVELIEHYFGIKRRRQSYYDCAKHWITLKDKAENIAVKFAQKCYEFNFELLLYDVTTLYFETFQEDDLRKNGFSKDNKSQQPQILIALMVTKEGFPVAYDIFEGNTFEGKTIIPAIKKFINKHKVNNFTVVADAAMLSKENITELVNSKINYIVGARLSSLPKEFIKHLDKQLKRKDGQIVRLNTSNGDLICSFSETRYRKDKYEMDKQIANAKKTIENPGKRKKLKFITATDEKLALNTILIDKTTKLLGVKGYYTDLPENVISSEKVIERYHELYKIEQAFRISKSDLKTRPIFHYKQDPIKLHVLICFVALVVSKNIELQTKLSIRSLMHESKKITDAKLYYKTTGKTHIIRALLTPKILEILEKLNC